MTTLTRDYLGVDTDEEALAMIAEVLGHPVPPAWTTDERPQEPESPASGTNPESV